MTQPQDRDLADADPRGPLRHETCPPSVAGDTARSPEAELLVCEVDEHEAIFGDDHGEITHFRWSIAPGVPDVPSLQTPSSSDVCCATQPSLDRKKAVAYAREWTKNGEKLRNRSYPQYGNDCTSFVSQVLHAGGWEMRGSLWEYRRNDAWFSHVGSVAAAGPLPDASWTWGGAHNLFRLMQETGWATLAGDWSQVREGDIVQVDYESGYDANGVLLRYPDGEIDHSMVVTERAPGHTNPMDDLSFTYHTTDNEDVAAADVREGFGGAAKYYAWRIP